MPTNQIGGIKYFGIFVDDLYLYLYDKREYSGAIKLVFDSINQIEKEKWALTKKILHADALNETLLPISNYTQFSD